MHRFYPFLNLLLLLVVPSASPAPVLTQLRSWNDGAVEKYLRQLSNYYQHCHIHTILYDDDAPISSMENPHVVTRPKPHKTYRVRWFSSFGGWAIPSFKHMIGRCQATFQVMLTKDKLPREEYIYTKSVIAEGKFTRYRLKTRYSILLIHADNKVRESIMDRHEKKEPKDFAGGAYFVLEYGTRARNKSGFNATLICYECPKRAFHLDTCPSILTYLGMLERKRTEMSERGVNVKWVFYENEAMPRGQDGPNRFFCLRPPETSGNTQYCTPFIKDAMLNYVVAGSLNISRTLDETYFGRLPEVSWSEDMTTVENEALWHIFPFDLYPLLSGSARTVREAASNSLQRTASIMLSHHSTFMHNHLIYQPGLVLQGCCPRL